MTTVGSDKRLNYYQLDPEEVIKELSSHKMGLTNVEAARRLKAHGTNTLVNLGEDSLLPQIAQACRNPIVLLVLIAIILTVFTGDLAVRVCLILLGAASVAVTVLLGRRRTVPLAEFAKLLPELAKVIRNGDIHTVEAATLVVGDIVTLSEGDIVPADVRIIEEKSFSTDDGTLTGNRSLQHKSARAASMADTPLFLRHGMAYAGTRVATGAARGIVTAVGMQTELGHIAAFAHSIEQHTPPFQRQLQHIQTRWAQALVAVAVASGLLAYATGISFDGIARLLLIILVSGTPLALLIELYLVRLESREQLADMHLRMNALSAIDALAAADIVIIDPSATHGNNETRATHVLAGRTIYTTEGQGYDPVGKIIGYNEQEIGGKELDDLALLFTAAALTSNAKVYQANNRHHAWRVLGDSISAATLTLARRAGVNTEKLHMEYTRVRRFEYSHDHYILSAVYDHGGETVLFVRGSVGAIAGRSQKLWDHNHIRNFTKGDQEFLAAHVESEALGARHTAALAFKVLPKNTDVKSLDIDDSARHLTFLGVISTHTPLHEILPDAVHSMHSAGVAVSMLANNEPATALAIARHAGVAVARTPGHVITSADFHILDDSQILQYVEAGGAVFSYLTPEDRLRLVEITETAGHTTVMTGYSLSDVPALAHASVGISITEAAGQHPITAIHGSALAGAIARGRLTYLHLQQAVRAVLTDSAALISLALFGIFGQLVYNQPPAASLLQVLIFSALVQVFPVIELAWDKSSEHIMQQHPKHGPPITQNVAAEIVMFGLLAGCIAYANFLLYFVRIHLSSAYIDPASNFSMHATSLAFVTLFVCQSLNLLFARAARHKAFFTQHLWSSQRLFAALGLALFIMLNLLYNPPLANMFGAVGLDVGDWSMVILAATVYICARLLQRHTRQHARHAVVKLHHKVYGKNSPARI